MTVAAATDCEGCGKQIGANALGIVNDHVTCWDGITSKVVTFHKHCHGLGLIGDNLSAASDPHVQRNHHIGLAPAVFPVTGRGIS